MTTDLPDIIDQINNLSPMPTDADVPDWVLPWAMALLRARDEVKALRERLDSERRIAADTIDGLWQHVRRLEADIRTLKGNGP